MKATAPCEIGTPLIAKHRHGPTLQEIERRIEAELLRESLAGRPLIEIDLKGRTA